MCFTLNPNKQVKAGTEKGTLVPLAAHRIAKGKAVRGVQRDPAQAEKWQRGTRRDFGAAETRI